MLTHTMKFVGSHFSTVVGQICQSRLEASPDTRAISSAVYLLEFGHQSFEAGILGPTRVDASFEPCHRRGRFTEDPVHRRDVVVR
jgi:hypothetical protein